MSSKESVAVNWFYKIMIAICVMMIIYDLHMAYFFMDFTSLTNFNSSLTYFFSCSIREGKIVNINLPFLSVWIATIWAIYNRWYSFLISLGLLVVPVAITNAIDDFSCALIGTPLFDYSYVFFGVMNFILALVMTLICIISFREIKHKAQENDSIKYYLNDRYQRTNSLFFVIRILSILVILALLVMFLMEIPKAVNSYFIADSVLFVISSVINPLMMLSVFSIWSSLKKWYPSIFLFLILSPITFVGGFFCIFNDTTLVEKFLGGLLLAFTCTTIQINIIYHKEKRENHV
jgi:uncharacterized membrane protein